MLLLSNINNSLDGGARHGWDHVVFLKSSVWNEFTSLIQESHTGPLISTLEEKGISILHLGNFF